MPIQADFQQIRMEDGALIVSLAPAAAIGQWTIRFQAYPRFGSTSGRIVASTASGFNNVSGINITNSGAGVFNVTVPGLQTSGLEYGNYAYDVTRLESGSRTVLVQGYLSILP